MKNSGNWPKFRKIWVKMEPILSYSVSVSRTVRAPKGHPDCVDARHAVDGRAGQRGDGQGGREQAPTMVKGRSVQMPWDALGQNPTIWTPPKKLSCPESPGDAHRCSESPRDSLSRPESSLVRGQEVGRLHLIVGAGRADIT